MKIILEAFNGKLRSEPLDFPKNTTPEIKMILDFRPTLSITELPISEATPRKCGTFQFTGSTYLLSDNKTFAARYVLVDVK